MSKTTWLYLVCLAAVAHIWFSTSGGHLLIPLLCRPFYPTQLPTPVVVCSPLGLVYLAPLWFYSCLIDAESLPSVEKHRVHPKAFVIRDCLESELRPLAQRPPRPATHIHTHTHTRVSPKTRHHAHTRKYSAGGRRGWRWVRVESEQQQRAAQQHVRACCC